MSKKLRANARHLIDDEISRVPADVEGAARSQDRRISKLLAGARQPMDSTDQRKIAMRLLREAGEKIGPDGIGVLPKLKAIPRGRVDGAKDPVSHAKVLDSQWAIYDRSQMPEGNPVVYDFNNDRWGVMTGMLEVGVSDPQSFNDTVFDLQSQGYQVVKAENSEDVVYVATGSTALEKINKVSEELKNQFGSGSVKAETIFVWRRAQ